MSIERLKGLASVIVRPLRPHRPKKPKKEPLLRPHHRHTPASSAQQQQRRPEQRCAAPRARVVKSSSFVWSRVCKHCGSHTTGTGFRVRALFLLQRVKFFFSVVRLLLCGCAGRGIIIVAVPSPVVLPRCER